jgi:DNA-binding response OmpR family regulator
MKKSQFVLIVDDDRDWAESVADLFLAYGYEVEIIANGRLAVERAGRDDFDIAFMDVQMPVMNGVDSFFEIRKLKPDARIVMDGRRPEPLVGRAIAAAPPACWKAVRLRAHAEIVETAA